MSSGSSDPLQLIHEGRLRLTQVTAHVRTSPFRAHTQALAMRFGDASCVVIAEPDDSLRLADASWTPDADLSPIIVSDQEPWRGALGKPLMWSWSMTNQQGYRDALQLELAQDVDDPPVLIQLVALGSEIKVRSVAADFVPPPRPHQS
jgi:hypothetical protein